MKHTRTAAPRQLAGVLFLFDLYILQGRFASLSVTVSAINFFLLNTNASGFYRFSMRLVKELAC
ncbi:hypothetical protein K0U00_21080 [Paenibacillus sepulcri]|uniref:Uncharacterized protein n=1 Tax=Paenibacillus sepulcri TaxID=359917 RepID=A0ABS7C6I6_9BACL|nr:hypothetical protein [Paenibacillus sepulcri]